MSLAETNIRITEPSNAYQVDEAVSVHAGWEEGYSEVDGSRQREGGVHVEVGELLPMEDGYHPQVWKVVGFDWKGVICVADMADDDHIIDYDSFEIHERNYTVLSYEKVEELKA